MKSLLLLLFRILEPIFGTRRPTTPAGAVLPAPVSTMKGPDPFNTAMQFILGPTRDSAKNDRAPGETFNTNQGVTDMTWTEATRQGIVTGDLANMTGMQRDAIYRTMYWNHLGCPGLNPGVALMVFNDGVLSGTGHAAKLLQRMVGAAEDGMVGPVTTTRADAMDPRALIAAIELADKTYLESLGNAPMFIRGWERREDACAALALAMV